MTRPRCVLQPGPAPADRILAVEARGRDISFDLEAGVPLLAAVEKGFAGAGFNCGVLELENIALAPLAYVIPALSTNGAHAAYYSDVRRPGGVTRITSGAMTFGRRDGQAFFHCHALWREADGALRGGHVLPDETLVAERATIAALGIGGALFDAAHDPETNFKLFEPRASEAAQEAARTRVIALRLRPNQDVAGALEDFCAARGIARARVRGGVGSTIGAGFDQGCVVDNFATEVFVRHGAIAPDARGRPQARLEIGLVDFSGAVAQGVLSRGDNPVLMTFELALQIDAAAA